MSKLRLVPPSGSPIEIDVTKDQTVLGRDPACDAVVADGSVSRRHARIEKRASGWAIVDQGSANGTFVDSQRTAEADLKDGQELRLGAVAFKIEIEGDDELGATMAAVPSDTILQVQPQPPKPAAAAAAPPPARPAPPPPRPVAAPMPVTLPPQPTAPPPPAPRPPAPAPAAPRPPRPGAPAPAQSMGAGGPAVAKKGKGPLFWTLTGCCGCLVLVFILGGILAIAIPGGIAGLVAIVDKTTGPAVETVKAMLGELKADQLDQAYARCSSGYRARVSRSDFEAIVEVHPALRRNAEASFGHRSNANGVVTLEDAVLVATGSEQELVTFRVVEESGAWKVDDIAFGSGSSSTTPSPSTASTGRLTLTLVGVNKTRAGKDTQIVIELAATGYESRPGDGGPQVDVIEDIETRGPDGRRVPSLTKAAIERFQGGDGDSLTHSFKTTITLDPSDNDHPPGSYRVLLTVHDMIGGVEASHEVTFELP